MSESPIYRAKVDYVQLPDVALISPIKISVPPQPDWVISRPRLAELLKQGTRGPLTVVTGPPGAGKTIAVSAWAASEKTPGPVAWVSLDGADHRPDLFWLHVIAAFRRAGAVDMPGSLRVDDHRVFRTELASAMAGRESPAVLVLDDFRPETDSALVDEITYVVRHAGPVLRLVLICRRDPPLPLHRYRLTGELTEIRADELAFGERETHALLAQHGISLSAESVRALRHRTEGWAAGVRLAAMSMEGHPDPAAFAAQFTGDDHAVATYLMEEVIEAQPDDMRRLLLTTSTAERFNAELAVELAGADAGRCFPALIRQNAFVVALGHGWYRYHHMFGDALSLMLRHESPAEPAELHRRAATWFSRRGLLADAVRHAARAADWRYASWLIVDHVAIGSVVGLRPGQPVAHLIGHIPEQVLATATEPEPALVVAAAALARGDDATCAGSLGLAERLLGGLPVDHALAARLAAGTIHLARPCAVHPNSLKTVLHGVDDALGRLPRGMLDDHPEMRALVQWGRGTVELWAGRLAEAETALRSAISAATEAGGDFQRRRCLGTLALVEVLSGRFRQATDLVGKAAQLPEVSTTPAGRRVAVAHLAGAWVALERYRLSEARLELKKADRALNETPDMLLSALHGMVTARVEIATGTPDRALTALAAARHQASGISWLERRLSLVESEAHTGERACLAATEATQRAGEPAAIESRVALARVQICAGNPAAAARLLRPALAESSARSSDVLVEARLLDACLAYQAGDPSRGRRSLDHALRLGEREQIVLPFAMAKKWLYAVLRHDPELLRPHRRLLEPLSLGVDGLTAYISLSEGVEATEAAIYGQLSARELDVLRHLSKMLTTEEIATEMYVSINTVKTHLKSIYRKLAVTRRGEAVRRAHHLQLL